MVILVFLFAIAMSFSFYFLQRTINRRVFYQNYQLFLEKTKIALYPDINHKNEKENISSWIFLVDKIQNKYNIQFIDQKPLFTETLKSIEKNDIQSAKTQIQRARVLYLNIMKKNNFQSTSIIMEDLLSLVLDMEKSVDDKDDLALIDQYRDFITKFKYIAPHLIKTDVIKIGGLIDLLYKKALYNDMNGAKELYHEIKELFIQSYQDFK